MDHILRTTGNDDPMHEVYVPQRIPRADPQNKSKVVAEELTIMLPLGAALSTID